VDALLMPDPSPPSFSVHRPWSSTLVHPPPIWPDVLRFLRDAQTQSVWREKRILVPPPVRGTNVFLVYPDGWDAKKICSPHRCVPPRNIHVEKPMIQDGMFEEKYSAVIIPLHMHLQSCMIASHACAMHANTYFEHTRNIFELNHWSLIYTGPVQVILTNINKQ